MRSAILGLSLFFCLNLQAAIERYFGEWKLTGMIHHGRPIALPNPELNLRWTFFPNGTLRLFWDRGGPEFCEGFAHFQIVSGHLVTQMFALNPNNAAECTKDTDLQIGHETRTRIEISPEQISLFFQLGDEELVYLLKKLP